MAEPLPAGGAVPPPEQSEDRGLLADGRALWQDVHGLVHAWLRLAEMETVLSARSLVAMMGSGLSFALLLISSWLGLLAAAALLLIRIGADPVAAVLLMVLFNSGVAALVYQLFLRQGRGLGWQSSLHWMGSQAAAADPAAPARPESHDVA